MEVKVTHEFLRGFFRLLCCTAFCCLTLQLSSLTALAQPATPAQPLTDPQGNPVRPFTYLENLVVEYSYVYPKLPKLPQLQLEATGKALAVASGTERKYERGADLAEVVQNVVHDFTVIVSDFLDCLDFKIIGLCYRISWTGISFDIYREYRLPVQNVESVQHPFESGYLPKLINELLVPIVETTYYPFAADLTGLSMTLADESARLTQDLAGFSDPPDSGSLDGDDEVVDELENIDEDLRFHNADPMTGGSRYAEYTLLPQIFNQIMGRLWFFCHDVLPPMIWSSYYPISIFPARSSVFSFFLYPAEMINRFLIPNSCAGVNNQIRGGKTPFDMLLTGNSTYDAMNLASPGTGCLGKNNGNWVPVVNWAMDSAFSVASTVNVMKAAKTASRLGLAYDFNPSRDRVQWSQNDRMPDSCVKLERFVRDFGDANLTKGDDPWNVAIHWRYFRCCRRGYHVLIGPSPQIRR